MNFFSGECSTWEYEAIQQPEARRADVGAIDEECLQEEQSWEEIRTREHFSELSHDEAEEEFARLRAARRMTLLGSSALH